MMVKNFQTNTEKKWNLYSLLLLLLLICDGHCVVVIYIMNEWIYYEYMNELNDNNDKNNNYVDEYEYSFQLKMFKSN